MKENKIKSNVNLCLRKFWKGNSLSKYVCFCYKNDFRFYVAWDQRQFSKTFQQNTKCFS